jgi:hypothetical protein
MGWGDMGSRQEFGHPDVLYFKQNEKHVIRLLDDDLPMVGFYHSCRDDSGNFVKVRCIGSRHGCRFCEVNNQELYAKAANSDRPYPFRSEFVKAVWVYELNAMKLLVGKQVWEKCIKPLGVSYGTLANRDLEVIRQDTNGQASYTVVPKDPTPFALASQVKDIPDVKNYIKWLDANATKVMSARMMGQQPVPASTTGFAAPTAQPGQMTASGGQPATPPASSVNDQERKELQAEFSRVMAKKFDPKLVEKLILKHGNGQQIDTMDPSQLRALIADYKMEAQVV